MCETFCTSTQSEKEPNSNSEVEVKSAYEPSGPYQAGAYPGFCGMEWLGVFLLPPG